MLKTTSTRVFKLSPREQTRGFLVFLSNLLSGWLKSHPEALLSINPGLLLIQFDLVWFWLLCRRGLSGDRNISESNLSIIFEFLLKTKGKQIITLWLQVWLDRLHLIHSLLFTHNGILFSNLTDGLAFWSCQYFFVFLFVLLTLWAWSSVSFLVGKHFIMELHC